MDSGEGNNVATKQPSAQPKCLDQRLEGAAVFAARLENIRPAGTGDRRQFPTSGHTKHQPPRVRERQKEVITVLILYK